VESADVDVVLVHALDRAGRNTVKLLQFVETCQAHGVVLVSVTQPIDTGSEYGGIIIAVLSAVAQMESKIKRQSALSKHLEDAEAGRYAGSYRTFGYTRQMQQVPAEVEAIRHDAKTT
jgi:site-specific DNA recombinase